MLAPEEKEREREREGRRERERERRRREGKVEERRSRRERKEKKKHSNQIGSDSNQIDKALEHSRIATTLPPLFFFHSSSSTHFFHPVRHVGVWMQPKHFWAVNVGKRLNVIAVDFDVGAVRNVVGEIVQSFVDRRCGVEGKLRRQCRRCQPIFTKRPLKKKRKKQYRKR